MGREVQLEARVLGQPALDPRMLMGGVVVHDDMHIHAGGTFWSISRRKCSKVKVPSDSGDQLCSSLTH